MQIERIDNALGDHHGDQAPNAITVIQSLGRYHAPPLVTDLDPLFGDRVMLGSSATQVATTVKMIVGDDKEGVLYAASRGGTLVQLDPATGMTTPVLSITRPSPWRCSSGSRSTTRLGVAVARLSTRKSTALHAVRAVGNHGLDRGPRKVDHSG